MFWTASVLATLLAAASAQKASRTFAVLHTYGNPPLTIGRMDPIVDPGVAAAHVHLVMGGNGFGLTMTADQALNSQCTTSNIKNDKSNYWVPSLYFEDPSTGSLTSVELFYMNVYYFFEATDDQIQPFPPGLRMVVGNATQRSPPSTGGALNIDPANGPIQPIQWTCPRQNTAQPLYPAGSTGENGVGIGDPRNMGAGVGFPDKYCDGYASPMRGDVHFPSCYNPAVGLDDFHHNMQYPSSTGASAAGRTNCPPGWIHTPHLFYETYFNTPVFSKQWTEGQGKSPWRLSSGDRTGYGYHGDFFAGWDTNTLQTIINTCDAGDSGMDKCPQIPGGVYPSNSPSCNIPDAIGETVTGTMSRLPGNNPLTGWESVYGASPAQPNPSPAASNPPASSPAAKASPSSSPAAPAPASSSATTQTHHPYLSSSVSSHGVAQLVQNGGGYGQTSPTTTPIDSMNPSDGAAQPTTTSTEYASTVTLPTTAYVYRHSPVMSSLSTPASVVPVATPESTLIPVPHSQSTPVPAVPSQSSTVPPAPMQSASGQTCGSTGSLDSPSNGTSPVPGWTYAGCWSDSSNDRVLTGIQFANVGQHAVSNTDCIQYCAAHSYAVAGTEFGGQCFCGNQLSTTSTELEDSECDMPCEGDATQTCGGGDALSVYKLHSVSRIKKRLNRHLAKHLRRHESV